MFSIRKTFEAAARLFVRAMPSLYPPDPSAPGLNIVVCQDSNSLVATIKKLARQLRRRGFNVNIHPVTNNSELKRHLQKRKGSNMPPPDAFFFDVLDVGSHTGRFAINWFKETHPDKPLPNIYFMSLSPALAIAEAGHMNLEQDDVKAHFIDPDELELVSRYLKEAKLPVQVGMPGDTAFRCLLRDKLGLELPMDQHHRYDADIKKMHWVANNSAIKQWQLGKMTAENMVEQLRGYALGFAATLNKDLYGAVNTNGIQKHAAFYSSTGFPVKGPVVFSVADAKSHSGAEKPILMMQGYDLDVVHLLATGALGGLVVTSPYLASHLKMLCETHMVSGLFGLMPEGATLTQKFNEEAKPDLPPYFDGDTAEVAGHSVVKGQSILINIDGNGIALTPPETLKTEQQSAAVYAADDQLQANIRNAVSINQAFAQMRHSAGERPFGIKINIDANFKHVRDMNEGIGLVRTEQMVAAQPAQTAALKKVLLHDDTQACLFLKNELTTQYRWIISHLDKGCPVKIRLFDIVQDEILNKSEQELFLSIHKRTDIRGGDALAVWPRLYEAQVDAIFAAYKRADITSGIPLEIMMPAVKNEQDVIAAKKLVDDAAQRHGVSQYSFGVMIETTESCAEIGKIAEQVDFISFGTNDLTQQLLAIPRNDAKAQARFEGEHGYNPFKTLAPTVLELMKKTIEDGRAAKPELKVDVCGAQAAQLDTALKLYEIGVDNISVAPTLANLHALPLQINYAIRDSRRPAAKPQPPKNEA